uniref:Uncharacterized protein n=1 Tax=Utricularia reniformis TaxID=192314 RepID=A0A1Y0AZJ5_9LAMI|nr:hypothetical protein AEK19_MT0329 [Utricularia reniformis]ART30602.1 hypothetical protein AEK19_MT0329 [Utricularia reniformis]
MSGIRPVANAIISDTVRKRLSPESRYFILLFFFLLFGKCLPSSLKLPVWTIVSLFSSEGVL